MAKRLAQRIGRRKRSHHVGEAEKIIPINRETAEIIAQQKKLFREQFGREPGPDDPLFFEPGVVAVPQFLSDESSDEIWKSLLQAAGDSGIDPAIVYRDEQDWPHRDRNQRTLSDRRRASRME